jgi:hypothetical protein
VGLKGEMSERIIWGWGIIRRCKLQGEVIKEVTIEGGIKKRGVIREDNREGQ